jgi:putative membrane protein
MNIGQSDDSTAGRVVAIALVALVFTAINAFVAPVIKTLSLPFIIITLGFALLVINALLLLLTEWITDKFDVAFHVDGFWWAVLGSIVVSIVNTVLGAFTGKSSHPAR